MTNLTLFQFLIANGVPETDMANHYSDLYVKVTPLSRDIIRAYSLLNGPFPTLRGPVDMPNTFMSITGEGLMYDIPFAYDPFWASKMAGQKTD